MYLYVVIIFFVINTNIIF